MTAINILVEADCAYLFCDTKTSILGHPAGSAVKCLPVPHINAAIATRGRSAMTAAALSIAANCQSFSDLKKNLGSILRDGRERKNAFSSAMKEDFDVFVIAFTEQGAQAFAVFSHDKHGHPPWTVIDIPYSITTPPIPVNIMEKISREKAGVEAILSTMAVQADVRRDVVGGYIQLTVVAADGIHTAAIGELPVPPPAPVQPSKVRLPDVFAKHLSKAS